MMPRWFRILRLRCRAYVLQAEVDNAEGLMADHERRYKNALYELAQVRRRLAAMESAQTILRRTV